MHGGRTVTTPVAVLVAVLLGLALPLTSCSGNGASTTLVPTTTLAPTTSTTVADASDWPQYHHDMGRSGASGDQEPLGEVTWAWTSQDLGHYIYAQPLVVGEQVIVATEGNNVFSLDAMTGEVDWWVELGSPVDGKTLPCGNIDPSGITGTPVIDTQNGIIYVVAFLSAGPHHRLYALDLEDGATLWSRTADPPELSPTVEQQRGALSLVAGMIYIPYGGLAGDCGEYRGAVVGVPTDGNGEIISYVVPTERMGGIWNPTGLPVDEQGNLWVATGNTASESTFDYGNAVLRMSLDLKWLDYFAPTDWVALNESDLDINTTAPVLLGDERVLIAGKNAKAYLLDTAGLGEVNEGLASVSVGSSAFGTAVAQGSRVFLPCIEGLVAVDVIDDELSVAWSVPGRTGSPIIAAGHVWTLGREGLIKAVDPVDGTIAYTLQITKAPTQFATLSSANGRVFVADGTKILSLSLR